MIDDPQEIFDESWRRVARQGAFGVSDDDQDCDYWFSNGRRCAVGVLLPEPTAKRISGIGVVAEVEEVLQDDEVCAWMSEHLELLADIQTAHDNAATSAGEAIQSGDPRTV